MPVYVYGNKEKKFDGPVFLLCLVSFMVLGFALFVSLGGDSQLGGEVVLERPEAEVWGGEFVVREVAEAYGVPPELALRVADFLRVNGINERFGGVGLYSVRPSHLEWIRGSVLQGTVVDLEDPIQNTQVAMYLLSGFHRQGYSWGSSALIYCFGFPAVHERGKYQDFLDFLGER
jgi:hypothetical protein